MIKFSNVWFVVENCFIISKSRKIWADLRNKRIKLLISWIEISYMIEFGNGWFVVENRLIISKYRKIWAGIIKESTKLL
jgi:hypothetical protein